MKRVLIATLLWVCAIGTAGAQTVETATPPPLIPFTGAVTDATGAPLVGLVSAIFSLYEDPEGGVPLWVDIQTVQTDVAGGFLTLLGAATELPVDLFATSQALWLGVQPEGQAEQPRVRFLSVPYALKASDADTLGGRPLAEFMLVDGASADGGGGGESRTPASSDKSAITNDLTEPGNLIVNGSVGVGTAFPFSRLSIEGNEADFRLTRTGGAAFLFQAGAGANATSLRGLTSNPMSFWTNNVERIRVAGDGKVGIGTSTPGTALDVNGTITGTDFSNPAGSQLDLDALAGQPFRVLIAGVEKMRVDPSGNVGVGTAAPTTQLHVNGTMRAGTGSGDVPVFSLDDAELTLSDADAGMADYTQLVFGSPANALDWAWVVSSFTGNMFLSSPLGSDGISFVESGSDIVTTVDVLHTSGDTTIGGGPGQGELEVNDLTVGGLATTLCIDAAGESKLGRCTSSIRYKDHVDDLNLGLGTVLNLRPVTFRWSTEGASRGQEDLGFIAEEVAELDPLLATFDDGGVVEGVKYRRMAALLTRGIQELAQTVEQQGAEIERLTRLVRELPQDER